jgi:hypothetical protein
MTVSSGRLLTDTPKFGRVIFRKPLYFCPALNQLDSLVERQNTVLDPHAGFVPVNPRLSNPSFEKSELLFFAYLTFA